MDDYANFRGLAGDVIVGFVKPGSLLSAIPVLIFLVVGIGTTAFLLPDDLFPVNLIIGLILVSFAVSRFAIPAQHGNYEDGWFSQYNSIGDSFAFSIRYVVITLCWALPCVLIMWLLREAGADISSMGINPLSIASSGLAGIVALMLLVIAIFAPTLGFLICTASESVSEVLGPAPWKELISNHKASLVVFYASMIGGIATFWLVYFFPLLLLVIAAYAISPTFGGALTGFVFSLPLLLAPILLGRLCGAFVCGISQSNVAEAAIIASPTHILPTISTAGALPVASSTSAEVTNSIDRNAMGVKFISTDNPTSALIEAQEVIKTVLLVPEKNRQASPYGPGQENSLKQLFKKIENVSALGLQNAILLTGNRVRSKPNDPFASAELSLLLLKNNELAKAAESMEISITLALKEKIPKLAMKLLLSAGKGKYHMKLIPAHWEKLSELFKKIDRFQTATYCLQAAGSMTAKKVDNFAKSAKNAGKDKELDWLGKVLIKKFPDSPQAQQARRRL